MEKHLTNDTLKLLRNRRSIRKFSSESLSENELEAILQCAFSAPSGCNKQPWHISVVNNKDLISEISSDTLKRVHKFSGKKINEKVNLFYNAPTVLFISFDNSGSWGAYDVGILTGNITTAADSLNLGSCIIGMVQALFVPAKDEDVDALISVLDKDDVTTESFNDRPIDTNEKYRKILDIPSGYEVAYAISIGHLNGDKPLPREITYKLSKI